MKIIKTGNTYRVYEDGLESFDALPAKTYIVRFEKNSGFFLEGHSKLAVNERLYGTHMEKTEKVLNTFSLFARSLGVILSGNKGIGKSVFARMLAEKATGRGLPVIIVDQYIPGIASYLESIEQEIMVLFDEFDKTFCSYGRDSDDEVKQTELLSLFDGISNGKKLFVITCNNLHGLSNFLINRPGRFHYHFRFEYPNSTEIREYLEDKLQPEFYGEIDDIIRFAQKVDINYDCLRAIAFEINTGTAFKDAILDLNIVNTEQNRYTYELHCTDGTVLYDLSRSLDIFNKEKRISAEFSDDNNDDIYAEFSMKDCVFDPVMSTMTIPGEALNIGYENPKKKSIVPEYISIVKIKDRSLHYTV